MNIGVDYYPEQWDKSLLQADADLMAKTGVKIVRVAEFAWSELEPQDGQFTFEWLDEVIRTFDKHGIEVILGVPTNCPPLWMYQAHPEIIQTDPDGRKKQLGIRGHRCINSPVFMTYAKRITEQMVRRYGTHKAVVAWQIDNELEAYTCCCDECKRQFRKWLLDRHDDLDTINAITGSVVWGNKYSDISQVDPPTAYPKAWQNPALCLEFYRFASESAAKFAKELAMVIHREVPRTKVTTNTWFCENTVDFYKLFEDMDITAYDNYPPLRIPADPDVMYSHAFELDLMRGIKDDKFWVMEQLSGITGSWAVMSPAPKPGMIMGYSLQAMAHGAETILHFRWRTAAKGAEMFWHGLLDHSNVPGRRFYEFAELCNSDSLFSRIGICHAEPAAGGGNVLPRSAQVLPCSIFSIRSKYRCSIPGSRPLRIQDSRSSLAFRQYKGKHRESLPLCHKRRNSRAYQQERRQGYVQ